MIKLWNWLTGWYHTWDIKRHNPALYKHLSELVDNGFDPDDYVEVPRPDGGSMFIHKDAVENMRKLGEEGSGPAGHS